MSFLPGNPVYIDFLKLVLAASTGIWMISYFFKEEKVKIQFALRLCWISFQFLSFLFTSILVKDFLLLISLIIVFVYTGNLEKY